MSQSTAVQTAPGEATVEKILVVGLLIVMVLYLLRELARMRMRGMRVVRPESDEEETLLSDVEEEDELEDIDGLHDGKED